MPQASTVVLGLVGLLAASPVHAAPNDLVARPLVLAPGQVDAALTVEVGLDIGRIARPLSLAPDAWVGVVDGLELGVIHSMASLDRITAGGSVCVLQALACDRFYRGSGLDARVRLREGAFAIAARARLVVRDLGPVRPALALGALARWTRGRFAITADPYLQLGLAHQEVGNRSELVVPLWFALQPAAHGLLGLHTGWDGELAFLHDNWHVPVGVFGRVEVGRVELGVEAGFPSLGGPQNNIHQRAVLLSITWHR